MKLANACINKLPYRAIMGKYNNDISYQFDSPFTLDLTLDVFHIVHMVVLYWPGILATTRVSSSSAQQIQL